MELPLYLIETENVVSEYRAIICAVRISGTLNNWLLAVRRKKMEVLVWFSF
jgi:hypothetical protein